MGRKLESDQTPIQTGLAGGRKPQVGSGEAIERPRIEVMNGKGGDISGVNTTRLEGPMESPNHHLGGTPGLDGVIDVVQVGILLHSGSRAFSISKELGTERREKISGGT